MSKTERRFTAPGTTAPVFESRRGTRAGTRTLSGLAAVFEQEIELMPRIFERIEAGAFKGVLHDSSTRLLLNHDSNYVLARVGAGSLVLRENADGLHFTAEVGAGGVGDNALDMIADQRLDQMSFGFIIGSERFEQRRGADAVRVIEEIEKLVDVSVVTFPAYSETSVALADGGRSRLQAHSLEVVGMDASRRDDWEVPRPNRFGNSISARREPGPICV